MTGARVTTALVAVMLAATATGCTSTPRIPTTAVRVDVPATPRGIRASTVVYVPLHGGRARAVGRVAGVTTTPQGLRQLDLQIVRMQKLPDDTAVFICTNHIKLQPQYRDGPPYLGPGFVIPVSRSVLLAHAC